MKLKAARITTAMTTNDKTIVENMESLSEIALSLRSTDWYKKSGESSLTGVGVVEVVVPDV